MNTAESQAERLARVPMPPRIAKLPRDNRGYPIPRFVHWADGVPDFRIMSPEHMRACVKRKVCWICGEPLGRNMVFVLGPMCCINRASVEPPCHYDCARYAATVCPFLAIPRMRRQDHNMPAEVHVAGIMVEHNPGACALWITRSYSITRITHDDGRIGAGLLFNPGNAERVEWFAEGRPAEAAEITAATLKGLTTLIASAKKESEGDSGAWPALAELVRKALPAFPDPDTRAEIMKAMRAAEGMADAG